MCYIQYPIMNDWRTVTTTIQLESKRKKKEKISLALFNSYYKLKLCIFPTKILYAHDRPEYTRQLTYKH